MDDDRNNLRPISGADVDPSASTRQRILATARRQFAIHGKAGARVNSIAQHAGVNQAMIYYHFQSKDDLYMEVIRDFYNHVKNITYGELDQTVSFETTLTLLAERFASLFDEISEFKPIILRELANPNPEVLNEIASIFQQAGILPRLMNRLLAGRESGEVRNVDFRQAVISFITMNLGYLFMAPLIDRLVGIDDTRGFAQERKKVVVDIFMNGLKPR